MFWKNDLDAVFCLLNNDIHIILAFPNSPTPQTTDGASFQPHLPPQKGVQGPERESGYQEKKDDPRQLRSLPLEGFYMESCYSVS